MFGRCFLECVLGIKPVFQHGHCLPYFGGLALLVSFWRALGLAMKPSSVPFMIPPHDYDTQYSFCMFCVYAYMRMRIRFAYMRTYVRFVRFVCMCVSCVFCLVWCVVWCLVWHPLEQRHPSVQCAEKTTMLSKATPLDLETHRDNSDNVLTVPLPKKSIQHRLYLVCPNCLITQSLDLSRGTSQSPIHFDLQSHHG